MEQNRSKILPRRRSSPRVLQDSLGLARSAAVERCRQAREEVTQAEQRLAVLLRQLAEERSNGVALAREVSAARAAVRGAKSKARRRLETGSKSRMQRELELLQRWKQDAVSILQQMQADVSTAQSTTRVKWYNGIF